MITQERLKELFYYNPQDGNLYNRVTRGCKAVKDTLAGAVDIKVRGTNVTQYRYIRIDGKRYLAHRLIWVYHYGSIEDSLHIDHINGDSLHNFIGNLRKVSNQENSKNQKRKTTNKSGVTGVHYCKRDCKWVASIRVNSKLNCVGYFKDFEQAVKARKEAEKRYGFHENHGREPVQVAV